MINLPGPQKSSQQKIYSETHTRLMHLQDNT